MSADTGHTHDQTSSRGASQGDMPDLETLRSALRHAETDLQRAQSVAYYAHRHLLESRSQDAAHSYRLAMAGCQEAVDALVTADRALRGADGRLRS